MPEANRTLADFSREPQQRAFLLQRSVVDVESRTVELAFSSEEPVDRGWGLEILDHGASSIRLGRLMNKGAVLVDHVTRDLVGVVESVWIGEDRVGRVRARFGKSPRADEVFQDVVDEIRNHVSVGYLVHNMVLESRNNSTGADTYRVTDWEPYEISIVSVPADPTVGVGRSAAAATTIRQSETGESIMPQENAAAVAAQAAAVVDTAAIETRAATGERTRVSEILAIGSQVGMQTEAAEAVGLGTSVEEFRKAALGKMASERGATLKPAEKPGIGMTQKEIRQFSFLRLLSAMAAPTDANLQRAAGFEMEVCAEAYKQSQGRDLKQGAYRIPFDVLSHRDPAAAAAQRDLNVGTASAGGNLVNTTLLSQSFIDLLVNRMLVMQLGTTVLDGLTGNVAIPRQTGGAACYWVTEGNAPTEGAPTFDQVSLTPKTAAAFVDYTRRFLLQSSISAEQFARMDLARALGLGIDLAAINGSGSAGQPTGILNVSGIGAVAGGANGLAPTWDNIVDLESQVANVNADVGKMAYLTNAKVRGKLKKTQRFSGTNGDPIWEKDNTMNGYASHVTNQVPSNLTKGTSSGVCSAIVFGNFEDLVLGMWGGLDIMVDPYTQSATGGVRVVAMQDVDVAVRHAESFAAMKDALTA